MTTLHGRRRVRGRGERPSQSHTEGTSDNVLGGVGAGAGAQGGELVPVPQEAPVVLARVHDEPAEEPAPRLPTQGLLGFPLGDVVADVDQLDEEDVRHARRDDHGVPHAGEGQGGAGGTKGGSAPRSLPSQSRHHPNIPTQAHYRGSGASPATPPGDTFLPSHLGLSACPVGRGHSCRLFPWYAV